MANRIDRYKSILSKMVRYDTTTTFPKHVFVRAANSSGNDHDRKGDRLDCFETTFCHLTERFNGKEVYLVGTTN